jgi:hypothetical protein
MSNPNLPIIPRFVPPRPKNAQKVEDYYVKRGKGFRIHREVEAMDFVRRHTSISVPSVFEIHVNEDDANRSSWFSMSAMSGSSLTDAWPQHG